MTKNLYTRIKIPFSNPYVVRLDHGGFLSDSSMSFQQTKSQARKLIQGTWGFSYPSSEQVQVAELPANASSIDRINFILDDSSFKTVVRSYWCFQDELDALQLRLMINEKATRVTIWPANILFTIIEIIETDE